MKKKQWQPMIDRCTKIADQFDEVLTRRSAIATSYDTITVHRIDDLETILFALRQTLHRLKECHCGQDGHALNSVNCPVHGYSLSSQTQNSGAT